ncbi:MAG: hypothetical protein EON86_18730 [Brevundimonas sp.]|nr:MAG: hypothetical protein EON86_18730 [Brevundimonas sp.]
MRRVAIALLTALSLAACQQQAEYAPWTVEAKRDEIRDSYFVDAAIFSNEGWEPQRPYATIRYTAGPDGVGVRYSRSGQNDCNPANPVIYRFDQDTPSTFSCVPAYDRFLAEPPPAFAARLLTAKRLVIEEPKPLLGSAPVQMTFDVEGFGDEIRKYPVK